MFSVVLSNLKLYKKKYSFFQYEVTYIRPNGHFKVELRTDLPRVCEFNDYNNHNFHDYIGCTTGLGWEIKTVRLVRCEYVGL